MKSRVRASKRMVAELEQEVFENTIEACEDNNAMFIMAIQEEFGFGYKRLKKVIERFNDISDRYSQMREEGYTHEDIHLKIVDVLNDIGFEESVIYSGRASFYEACLNARRIKKKTTEVSYREASDAQEALKFMMHLQNQSSGMLNAAVRE